MSLSNTEQKLIEALERIKSGETLYTEAGRKLSISSIEDEAGVSRSLSRRYPETFNYLQAEVDKYKEAKRDKKPSELKVVRAIDEVEILREKNKLLNERLNKSLAANVALAERVKYLESLFDKQDNVVSIKK